MSNIRLLFFLFLIPFCGIAQNKSNLSGYVRESSGEAAAYVSVAIKDSVLGTQTDEKGYYSLDIESGKYTLVVSSLGYKTISREIEIRTNKQLDFRLESDAILLNAVAIYGKSKNQQLKESAFSVNAINVSTLQNTSANLNDLISRTTSVRVREDGGLGSDSKLSINGLSGHSIRYFIDGVPLASLGSGVSLANIPTNIVDRIEIYKGVVPTHLGADALGGAIHIVTKQNTRNYLDVSYGAGSFHTHKGDICGQYVHKPSGFILRPVVGINYSKNDYTMRDVEVWDEAEGKYKPANFKRFHDNYFSFLGQLEAGFRDRTWADALLFSGSVSVEDKDIQTGDMQTFVYGKAHREREAWSVGAQYRKKELFVKPLDAELSLSYTHDHSITIDTAYRKYSWDGTYADTYRNEINGGGKSIRHYKRPLTIARANLNYDLAPGQVLNFNYLLNSVKNDRWDEMLEAFEPSEDLLTKHILGLSYNQSLLGDRLTNHIFIKQYINHLLVQQTDNSSKTGSKEMAGATTSNFTGYGIGSRFSLRKEFALKASYEHSVRLPVAMEVLGDGIRVYPNFRLKPENSDNFNLGFFGTWRLEQDHRLFYEAGGFIREVKDYIHRVISEKDGLSQYENVNDVTVKGVESEIRYEYSDLFQAVVNCSYQDAINMTKYDRNGLPNITYKNTIPNQPWLFANAEINLTLRDLIGKQTVLRLGYLYQYTHWFYLTWEGYGKLDSKAIIPTQHVHNANISYSFCDERYNLSLECDNLLDRTLYDNYLLQKPGRSFFVKFRMFIN